MINKRLEVKTLQPQESAAIRLGEGAPWFAIGTFAWFPLPLFATMLLQEALIFESQEKLHPCGMAEVLLYGKGLTGFELEVDGYGKP